MYNHKHKKPRKKPAAKTALFLTHDQQERAFNCLRLQALMLKSMGHLFDINNLPKMTTNEMVVAYVDSQFHPILFKTHGLRGEKGKGEISRRMYNLMMVNSIKKMRYAARSPHPAKTFVAEPLWFTVPIVSCTNKVLTLQVFGQVKQFGSFKFPHATAVNYPFAKIERNDKGFYTAQFVRRGSSLKQKKEL